MPNVHIHIARGRDSTEKKAILDGVHAALVEAFRIPEEDRKQILHEHDPEHFDMHRGPGYTLIELTVFPGRSVDAKRKLYEATIRNLARAPGIDPLNILIVLHEPSLECWGIRGGRMASEVQLGFKLDV